MLTHGSILVSLLWLVEQIPTPSPPGKRPRGRQEFYSDKLFVKALIVMIIRRLYTAYALLNFLEQADPVAQQVRLLLTEHGRFPTRRTWDRRFATLPARLPALIGCLGRHLVTLLSPGPPRDMRPPSTVRPCAPTAASGIRNIGWPEKSHIPRLTPKPPGVSPGITAGGTAGSCIWRWSSAASGFLWRRSSPSPVTPTMRCPKLLEQLPMAVRYVLGDTHYNTPELRQECALHNRELVATRRGRYPHRDGVSKSAGFFISYVRWRLSRSTACSKTSLNGVLRCRSTPEATPLAALAAIR